MFGASHRRRLRALALQSWPAALLAGATVAFRAPVIVNAAALNSDMAVVGLQAMHILRGEWSWYLWGAGYQSSIDALLTAVAFALFGSSPQAFGLVPILGHLALVGLAYAVVKPKFSRWQAILLTMPMVVTSMAINYTLIMVQRQACTIMFALSVFLLDRAAKAKRPIAHYACGGFCVVTSVYLDLYGMQWLPAVAVFAVLCALDGRERWLTVLLRMLGAGFGAAIGLISFFWLRGQGEGSSAQLGLATDRLQHNLQLLQDICLPWALGYRVFYNNGASGTSEWTPSPWFHYVQLAGAFALMLGALFACGAFFWRRIPWEVRRLGIFGVGVSASSIGAFLVSVMPSDQWSTRYLAPIVLVLPFTLAPAVYALPKRIAAAALAPYLIAVAVGGWMSYGLDYRDGPWPVKTAAGRADEERDLVALLRRKGINVGAAQYWLSYRLTFLFKENPVIVPLSPGNDRYPPYRQALARAGDVAYIVHPSMPWVTAADQERELVARGARYERLDAARYTVFIEHR